MALLDGKIAIITGAASGIGRATADLFADQGASVVLVDINEAGGKEAEASIRARGGEALFLHADVSESDEVQAIVGTAKSRYGRIDVLVNNAGVGMKKQFHLVTEEEWDRLHRINLRSMFLYAKYVIPHMLEQGKGSIVNVSSVHAEMTQRNFSIYASTKGGIEALTRGVAIDYADRNIRVNAVVPGCIYTEDVQRSVEQADDPQALYDFIQHMQPMKRAGTPAEVAQVILFLASDLSSFVTGSCYAVDGGFKAEVINSEGVE